MMSLSHLCLTLDTKRIQLSLVLKHKNTHLSHQIKEKNTVTWLPMNTKVLL